MAEARVFTIASLVLGLLTLIITPPFCVPDEAAHLYRAWSIAHGEMFVTHGGAMVPQSMIDAALAMLKATRGATAHPMTISFLMEQLRAPLRPAHQVFLSTKWYTAPGYTPLGYVVVAITFALTAPLRLPPVLLMYLGRLANLIAATALIAFAIRRAPFGRSSLALLALTPMTVFFRASLSIDSLLFAVALALPVEIIRAERPSLAALFSFAIAAMKPGYALLPAFAFVRASRKRLVLAVIVAAVAGTAATALWLRSVGSIADPAARSLLPDRISAITHSPLIFTSRLAVEGGQLFKYMAIEIAGKFGWLDAPVTIYFTVIWLTTLVVLAFLDGPNTLPRVARLFAILIVLTTAVSLFVMVYLFAVPGRFISGLQGRYFLPLLPLAVLAAAQFQVSDLVKRRAVIVFACLGGFEMTATLIERYWI